MTEALFIAVEVDDPVANDPELAAKLEGLPGRHLPATVMEQASRS